MVKKDTKKSKTWLCLDAPIKPRIEINIKMIPQANIPPTIGRLVTIDAARPYTPTLINRNPTIYKQNNITNYRSFIEVKQSCV